MYILANHVFLLLLSSTAIGEAVVRKVPHSLENILFVLFFSLGALFAIVRIANPDLLNGLIRGVSSPRHAMLMLHDGRLGLRFTTVALDLIYLACMALLLQSLMKEDSVQFLLRLFIYVTVFYLAKIIIISLLRHVFFSSESANIHLHEILLFNKTLGLALLPLLALHYFSGYWQKELLVVLVIVVGAVFLYRFIRIFRLMRSNYSYGNLYFFFYLCTVEITPYLVVFKGFLQPNLIRTDVL